MKALMFFTFLSSGQVFSAAVETCVYCPEIKRIEQFALKNVKPDPLDEVTSEARATLINDMIAVTDKILTAAGAAMEPVQRDRHYDRLIKLIIFSAPYDNAHLVVEENFPKLRPHAERVYNEVNRLVAGKIITKAQGDIVLDKIGVKMGRLKRGAQSIAPARKRMHK